MQRVAMVGYGAIGSHLMSMFAGSENHLAVLLPPRDAIFNRRDPGVHSLVCGLSIELSSS